MKKAQNIVLLLALILTTGRAQDAGNQQILYKLSEVPVVDMHTHLSNKSEYDQAVKTMDGWGGVISISLNGGDSGLMQYAKDSLNNRILLAGRGKHFSPTEIQVLKKSGFVGLKSHLRYHTLASEIADEQIEKMGELNFPFIGLHVADPPEDHYYEPDKFMVAQQDAERVIRKHPETNFIMAHGFYLTNRDADIDTLRKFFDRNPNLYADIVCTKWWDDPQPSYVKIRKLLIDYKDRFLFGTDFQVHRSAPAFKYMREKLETAKPLTFGMNGGPFPGLALPLDVINRIYYWNAAKIIPGVKEALGQQGFKISDLPPVSSPIIPDLDYNPPHIQVLLHPDTVKLSDDLLNITVDLSSYDRTVAARLNIMNYKKKLVTTLFEGEIGGRKSLKWDMKDKNGIKVKTGYYRFWLILEENKSAESNFNLE